MTIQEEEIAKQMNIEVIKGTNEELKEKYDKQEIDLYITKDVNKYIINTNGSQNSTYAKELVENYLNTYKQFLQQDYLQNKNINPNEVFEIIMIENNVIEEENFFASYIKNYAFTNTLTERFFTFVTLTSIPNRLFICLLNTIFDIGFILLSLQNI